MFAHPHSLNERDVPMISRVLTRAQSDPLRQVGARHSPPSDLSVPGPIPDDTAAIIACDMVIKLKRDSLSPLNCFISESIPQHLRTALLVLLAAAAEMSLSRELFLSLLVLRAWRVCVYIATISTTP